MRFIELCESARCSPDFAFIHRPDDPVAWLTDRLARFGHPIGRDEVAKAMRDWDDRPPVATHVVRLRG